MNTDIEGVKKEIVKNTELEIIPETMEVIESWKNSFLQMKDEAIKDSIDCVAVNDSYEEGGFAQEGALFGVNVSPEYDDLVSIDLDTQCTFDFFSGNKVAVTVNKIYSGHVGISPKTGNVSRASVLHETFSHYNNYIGELEERIAGKEFIEWEEARTMIRTLVHNIEIDWNNNILAVNK